MSHKLSFTLPLADSPDLIFGNLKLTYPDGHAIDYLATSGCAGWQRPEDQSARARGPIPAGEYEIPTTPYWLDTRGIEGWFFHLTPDPVRINGVLRGEFGIHFDAGGPGSAGCIVLKNLSGWERFCDRLHAIAKLGIKSIPLSVKYR
ncbi:MAG: tlde1 domain-containing protein [Microcoleus sp.]